MGAFFKRNEQGMIFVTVGTHEQQFNRLVGYMDKWAADHDEEVVIQTGFSTYEPKTAKWQKFFSYTEMSQKVKVARIVITHGGPSSFIAPLQIGKIPIVVPRKYEFGEHVNDHQVNFCKQVAERNRNIIVIESIEKLGKTITGYETIMTEMPAELKSNNRKFCEDLEKIVEHIIY